MNSPLSGNPTAQNEMSQTLSGIPSDHFFTESAEKKKEITEKNTATLKCSPGQSLSTWELSCRRMWETASLPQDQPDTHSQQVFWSRKAVVLMVVAMFALLLLRSRTEFYFFLHVEFHTLYEVQGHDHQNCKQHVFFIFFNLLLFNFYWEILQRHQSINSFNKCFIFIQRSCCSVSFVIIKTCINNMIIHNSDMFKLHLEFLPVCCILMWPCTSFCTFVVGNSDGNR